MRFSLLFVLVMAATQAGQWIIQNSGLDTNLRGVSAVESSRAPRNRAVWACGSKGAVLRSPDGGKSWQRLSIPGGEALDFRAIVALPGGTAYVMSIGNGAASRIYKTADDGRTWQLEFTGNRAEIFLDDLNCISATRCFALGDPVDGKFLLLKTDDGRQWTNVPTGAMPPALPGEGIFAASNSNLAIHGKREIYFATGGAKIARVFHSPDLGRSWTVSETPITSANQSSGIFSLARIGKTVVIAGGDYRNVNQSASVAAYSRDAGRTWQLAAKQPGGFRSAVIAAKNKWLVVVGPNGEDVSRDGGETWTPSGSLNLNAAASRGDGEIWGVGANGAIARLPAPHR